MDKYGSLDALSKPRYQFRKTKPEEYKDAHNDYESLMKCRKFIENNLQSVAPTLHHRKTNNNPEQRIVDNSANFDFDTSKESE